MAARIERYSRRQDPHGWRQELSDLMAAIAGGSIVGMRPLHYRLD